jgi:hypothetical protein
VVVGLPSTGARMRVVAWCPREPVTAYRWLTDAMLTEDQFRPQHETRDRLPGEDYLNYRGFSAWLDPDIAREQMEDHNREGRIQYVALARFEIVGSRHHLLALTGPPQHISVWGEASRLASSARLEPPKP